MAKASGGASGDVHHFLALPQETLDSRQLMLPEKLAPVWLPSTPHSRHAQMASLFAHAVLCPSVQLLQRCASLPALLSALLVPGWVRPWDSLTTENCSREKKLGFDP